MTDTTKEAYEQSIALLREITTPKGFLASSEDITNYKRVWARDGVIAGIAALMADDELSIGAFVQTLSMLKKHQDETGRIPSNVSLDETHVSYGTTVGRIDATIWYIIGVCQYALYTKDKEWFAAYRDSVERALFYLRCLELNGRGLVYIPYGGDWADEYINHGYVLFDQMLHFFALDSFAKVTGDGDTKKKREDLTHIIEHNYLLKEQNKESVYICNKRLFEEGLEKYRPPFPIPYFSGHSVRYHVDNFANSLMLLAGFIPKEESDLIRDTMIHMFLQTSFPVTPAFHPVIEEGDDNWIRLQKAYLFEFKNKPHEYHNGGLWPLVNGFFLATLGEKDGPMYLDAFAAALARDRFIFPEYYHGKTHEPKGTRRLSFSASGFIIAYQAIMHKKPVFL